MKKYNDLESRIKNLEDKFNNLPDRLFDHPII